MEGAVLGEPGVGVGIEVDQRHLAEPVGAGDTEGVGPGDGVVPAEDDRAPCRPERRSVTTSAILGRSTLRADPAAHRRPRCRPRRALRRGRARWADEADSRPWPRSQRCVSPPARSERRVGRSFPSRRGRRGSPRRRRPSPPWSPPGIRERSCGRRMRCTQPRRRGSRTCVLRRA
jgi:hypothetical protein